MIQARFKHLEAAVVANRAHECHDSSERRPRICSPLGNCSFDAARLRPGLTRRDGTEALLSRFLFILENPFAVAVRRDRRPRRAPHSFCHRNLLLIRQSAAKATARPLALALLVAQQPPSSLPPSFSPFIPLLCSFLLSLSHRRRRRQTHCSAAAAAAIALLPLSLTLKSRMAAMAAAGRAKSPPIFPFPFLDAADRNRHSRQISLPPTLVPSSGIEKAHVPSEPLGVQREVLWQAFLPASCILVGRPILLARAADMMHYFPHRSAEFYLPGGPPAGAGVVGVGEGSQPFSDGDWIVMDSDRPSSPSSLPSSGLRERDGGAYLAKSDSAKSESAIQERAKPYLAKPGN